MAESDPHPPSISPVSAVPREVYDVGRIELYGPTRTRRVLTVRYVILYLGRYN